MPRRGKEGDEVEETKWELMRSELMGLRMTELKALARSEGIALGYAASCKDSCVGEIVAQRRHRELTDFGRRA